MLETAMIIKGVMQIACAVTIFLVGVNTFRKEANKKALIESK